MLMLLMRLKVAEIYAASETVPIVLGLVILGWSES